jgi:protoheme IX farnesyltransferase
MSSQSITQAYLKLCKPNVVALLVLTAVVGMLLASPGIEHMPWGNFLFGTLGITLVSASAAAINHIIDNRIDEKMQRTHKRPIPQGKISMKEAIIFAIIIGVFGEMILLFLVNSLTALLTGLALIGYAFIYTVYLKHATPQNIVIGGASGAAPPLLGWVAITGQVSIEALILFLIIFVWTPPHFWALAIHRKEEYANASIPMLPITHGIQYTRQQILLYKILLIVISIMPFVIGMSGWLYFVGALALGGWYLSYAILMIRYPEQKSYEMKSFWVSIWYLLFLFCVLLVDHYATIYLGSFFGQKTPFDPF